MTTTELYSQLLLYQTLIITTNQQEIPKIRKRLAKRRYKDKKQLGEFADSRRLQFTMLPDNKLRIDLLNTSGEELNIESIQKGQEL